MGNLGNPAAGQVLVLLATLAFLTVSTIALAHGHTHAQSVDESPLRNMHGRTYRNACGRHTDCPVVYCGG